MEVTGPVVEAIQFSFLEDWHWATGDVPELEWAPRPAEDGNQNALVLASGPADDLETCELFFVHSINAAKRRLWIASPYFVPDGPLIAALQLAALRGVDVRIMLPERPDHKMVYLAAFSYIEECEPTGVKFYRYEPGFMHHKVILVDDDFAAVGTANFDNRSTRLNFEMMVLFADEPFASQVAKMLEKDFSNCRLTTAEEFADAWLLVSRGGAGGAADGAGCCKRAGAAARHESRLRMAGLLEADREAGADEVIVGCFVEADAGADVPLDIVAQQHGEAAVEVLLRVIRVRAARNEAIPFGVAADVVGPTAARASRIAQIPRRGRWSRRRPVDVRRSSEPVSHWSLMVQP